ncbi:ATP-binding protein [Massilia antarctica]|uniref:ATP-binding protein n=1 Tax=Massilia antarctica TaxID=2765360 RepID=UPI0006BB799C|nr:ATP-binding protein [Massilia sp. H27-R4]CUI06832.1 Sensor histidine kinase [Janthinobacterium sp. CG23_2]CUU30618.1 Sensor histidine kinase [Janthinobacterium sp. CG23_2]
MKAFFGSMTGRVFLTLLLGVVITAVLTQLLAENERQRVIEAFRDQHAMDRSEQLITATETVPASARLAYLDAANRPGIQLVVINDDLAVAPAPTPFTAALAVRMGPQYKLASIAARPPACDVPRIQNSMFGPTESQWKGVCESINVRLRDGELLRLMVMPPPPSVIAHETDYRMIIGLFLVSIAFLAYLVARMTTRPLKQLAQAAKDLGNDINHPPLQLAGASEIRQASAAFNAMQARIRQYIFQRTQMLAAITHDLQTPLTRMRLRLEKVGDSELRDRLVGDLSAMQEMVREGLDLARSTDTTEAMQALDLDSLLDSVTCDATDAGQQVVVHGHAGMALLGRPMALRRCLVNLIDNAVKYGQRAHVTVDAGAGAARIRVRDNGPGIAPGELARVFEPFYRVETSRSRESGGTGLGLTIARNIAEQHGGSIALINHPEGGLEVTLVLPEYYAGK